MVEARAFLWHVRDVWEAIARARKKEENEKIPSRTFYSQEQRGYKVLSNLVVCLSAFTPFFMQCSNTRLIKN